MPLKTWKMPVLTESPLAFRLEKQRPISLSSTVILTHILPQFAWAFILSLGLFCLPESPKYLILKGQEEDAKNSLSRLLSLPVTSPQVLSEYEEVCENLRAERALGTSTYADCFKSGPGKYRLRTLTGMGIQALQQLTG
jgi:hypothetical protein